MQEWSRLRTLQIKLSVGADNKYKCPHKPHAVLGD